MRVLLRLEECGGIYFRCFYYWVTIYLEIITFFGGVLPLYLVVTFLKLNIETNFILSFICDIKKLFFKYFHR